MKVQIYPSVNSQSWDVSYRNGTLDVKNSTQHWAWNGKVAPTAEAVAAQLARWIGAGAELPGELCEIILSQFS